MKIIQSNYWIPINFKYWVMLYIVCSWTTTWLGNRKVTMPMLSQYGAMLILVNGVKQKISNTKNKKTRKTLTSFWWTSKCRTRHTIPLFIYGIVNWSFKRIRRIKWVNNPHVVTLCYNNPNFVHFLGNNGDLMDRIIYVIGKS